MLKLLIRILCEIGKWADGEDSLEAKEREFFEMMERKYGDEFDGNLDEVRGSLDEWEK